MKKTCGVYACDRLKPSFEYINNQANSSRAPTIGQPQLLPFSSHLSAFISTRASRVLACCFFDADGSSFFIHYTHIFFFHIPLITYMYTYPCHMLYRHSCALAARTATRNEARNLHRMMNEKRKKNWNKKEKALSCVCCRARVEKNQHEKIGSDLLYLLILASLCGSAAACCPFCAAIVTVKIFFIIKFSYVQRVQRSVNIISSNLMGHFN